jgi:hypothetical protein
VTVPIHVVPHASDVSRFQRSYEPLDQLKPHKDAGEFLFYFGRRDSRGGRTWPRWSRASTWSSTRRSRSGWSSRPTARRLARRGTAQVEDYCREIKRGLKLHGGKLGFYKPEVVITDRLTETGMMRLHAAATCSSCRATARPGASRPSTRWAWGRRPSSPTAGGSRDYVSDETGWLVTEHSEPVFGVTDTFEDLFVGDETWSVVSIRDLRKCMRRGLRGRAG